MQGEFETNPLVTRSPQSYSPRNPMPAPESVLKLCETFADHRDHYRSGSYNEAQLRKEFLDPFFAALGWDMDNAAGLAPQYRDVIHEDALRVGVHVKAPDYAFTLHGQRKFFLEAKKPAVNIKSDVDPAYQLRRYAWSAKMPLSILSDFEEFAIYDTRVKPVKNDPSSKARTFYCTFDQYAEKWDEIAAIFSRDAILKGSFDKYADSNKKKKGTAEVDAAFLEEIERWRDLLARNLALRNPALSVRDLNFAVQKTIDRLVFLRICEDRGTEDYGKLRSIANGPQTYPRLLELFRAADARYNSGLFHFSKEKGQAEEPDTLTPHLLLDDKVLKDIIVHLYYPDSPYEFSVLPADILGSVYEQFLGKVINLTAGHRAVVEDKPEVKKAGGVFYTPSYIVDYIVKQTVGPLIEDKTPKQIEAIRILDPACGSGSFLIVVYQFLLDWYHRHYISHDPEKLAKGKNPVLVPARGGGWALTTAERKRILLAHIFGVDIDSQAVEVTKLSLLLKVLEGETTQSVQRELIHQRVLPDLGNNIKCGNSLIGSDFYDDPQMLLLDGDSQYRINVFDWKTAFPEVFERGGFDCVIGNPPYVRIQAMKDWAPVEVEIYKKAYASAASGNYDLYVVFVEKALRLINAGGRVGFILPHKFFNAHYGRNLRQIIAEGRHLSQIVHFGHHQVFSGATTYTCLLFLDRIYKITCPFIKVHDLHAWRTRMDEVMNLPEPENSVVREDEAVYQIGNPEVDAVVTIGDIPLSELGGDEWNFGVGALAKLMGKLHARPNKLGDVARLFVGIQTDGDAIFILHDAVENARQTEAFSKESNCRVVVESTSLRRLLKGSVNLDRYQIRDDGKRLLFPYQPESPGEVVPLKDIEAACPGTFRYLMNHSQQLKKRGKGLLGSSWHGYVYRKNHARMVGPKILCPAIARGAAFALDSMGDYFFTGSGSGGGGAYGIRLNDDQRIDLKFLLALLNSKLADRFFKANSTPFRGGWIALTKQHIENFPIRVIDPANKSDLATHDRIVTLVEKMLDLHKQRAAAKTPHEQTALDRQISATDAQIDRLVYDLYGLTEEEIKLVECA